MILLIENEQRCDIHLKTTLFLTITMHSSPFVALTVFISVIGAILKVPLVSPAVYIIHGKVTWNRAPVGILVGVSSCVSQLTTDHISVATASAPGIITDRSKVAVGVDCIHISVFLRRLNRPSSSSKLHMETVVCCCRCWTCCRRRCCGCRCLKPPSLADHSNSKVLEGGSTLEVSVECSKLSPTL